MTTTVERSPWPWNEAAASRWPSRAGIVSGVPVAVSLVTGSPAGDNLDGENLVAVAEDLT